MSPAKKLTAAALVACAVLALPFAPAWAQGQQRFNGVFYTFPVNGGSAGQCLKTNGGDTMATLVWDDCFVEPPSGWTESDGTTSTNDNVSITGTLTAGGTTVSALHVTGAATLSGGLTSGAIGATGVSTFRVNSNGAPPLFLNQQGGHHIVDFQQDGVTQSFIDSGGNFNGSRAVLSVFSNGVAALSVEQTGGYHIAEFVLNGGVVSYVANNGVFVMPGLAVTGISAAAGHSYFLCISDAGIVSSQSAPCPG